MSNIKPTSVSLVIIALVSTIFPLFVTVASTIAWLSSTFSGSWGSDIKFPILRLKLLTLNLFLKFELRFNYLAILIANLKIRTKNLY